MDTVSVLAVGPIPPPYHGVATYLRDLLESDELEELDIALSHVDTSDRRDASNLGRWDAENLGLGFANLAELAGRCRRTNADVVYLPLSQNVPAFLRDALFIVQSRLQGKRVVVHLHGGYFRTLYEQRGAVFQAIVRVTLRCADAVIINKKTSVPFSPDWFQRSAFSSSRTASRMRSGNADCAVAFRRRNAPFI